MPGPGNRETVAANTRTGPIYSLLTAAEMVPPDVAETPADVTSGPLAGIRSGPRWLNGIRYRRERCGAANAIAVGCDPSDEYIEDTGLNATRENVEIHTDPFMVWTADTCSTIGWSAADYVGRAQRQLAATEAYAVEKEFWDGAQVKAGIAGGVAYPNDQFLAQNHTVTILNATNSTDASTATAVHPGIGFAELQSALGDCNGGAPGMIHIPPVMLGALTTLMVVTPIPANGNTPNRLYDLHGNRVVPGAGYSVNTGPDGNAAAAGKAWLYATGLVYIRRDDPMVFPDTYAQATDRLLNDVTFRVERDYLVDWDRCCHLAVLVNTDVSGD